MKKMLENMTDKAFCDIVKETLEVIKKIDGDFLNKLPTHIKECLYKYSEKSNKIINIDITKLKRILKVSLIILKIRANRKQYVLVCDRRDKGNIREIFDNKGVAHTRTIDSM